MLTVYEKTSLILYQKDIWDFGLCAAEVKIYVICSHTFTMLLSRFSRVDSVRPHRRQPTRLRHP